MRLPAVVAVCLVLAACGAEASRANAPTDEELRLMAFLAHDRFVTIERTERDSDGRLLVITRQGSTQRRYLLSPDDPARPELRLRRLDDECTLATVPGDTTGVNPVPR